MKALPPPDNGGGQVFETPDGRARLLMGGHFNIEEIDMVERNWKNEFKKPGRIITYKRKAPAWYVVSGVEEDGTGFYIYFTSDKHYCAGWSMTYPQKDEKKYAPWIEKIYKGYQARLGKGYDTI